MLYTRKGDDGTTKVFNSPPGKRISKSSCQTEALGTLDELNSFLGILKVKLADEIWGDLKPTEMIHWVQNSLFIIQAEVAGSEKMLEDEVIKKVEEYTDKMEADLPPIKTFFISGGTELAATSDYARTLARTAERRVIGSVEEGSIVVGVNTLAFLNRLSSLLYALARLSNHKAGIEEKAPTYN